MSFDSGSVQLGSPSWSLTAFNIKTL